MTPVASGAHDVSINRTSTKVKQKKFEFACFFSGVGSEILWDVGVVDLGLVLEAGVFGEEEHLLPSGGAVTVLGDDDLGGESGGVVLLELHLLFALAVEERDDVGVLLDGAGLSEEVFTSGIPGLSVLCILKTQ